MAEAEKLTVKDAGNAQKALLSLVLNYNGFPQGFQVDNSAVKWNSTNESGMSIGIFPLRGAVYVKKYVDGSYIAQMPFRIVYKSSPTTNRAKIEAQELLDKLAVWLENSGIEFKDTHFTLESIERTSPVFYAETTDKMTACAVDMQLKYFYGR